MRRVERIHRRFEHAGAGRPRVAIGERAGPGFPAERIVPAVERLIDAYLELREDADEPFIDTYRRLGMDPFKAALYEQPEAADAA